MKRNPWRTCGISLIIVLWKGGGADGAIRYVDDSAPAGGNGTSWATASRDLQQTLATADPGDEIRVGQGLYRPAGPGGDRAATFTLHDGMSLKGGGIKQMINGSVSRNVAHDCGGIYAAYQFTLKSSVLWGNIDYGISTQRSQLFTSSGGTYELSNNTIQGWDGSLGGMENNGLDPLLRLPLGFDGIAGTADDDLHLSIGSPAADTGDNAALPADTGDVDDDGDTAETMPLDIDGNARISDDPTAPPAGLVVNRGAYESSPVGPHIVAWRSVRSHFNIKPPLAIPLDPSATGNGITGPGTESRQGGLREIEIDFDAPVQLKMGGSVSVIGRITSGGVLGPPIDFSATAIRQMLDSDTLRIQFNTVIPDRACYTIDVANAVIDAANVTPLGDTDCEVRSLAGDTTSSGDITLSDAIRVQTAANAGTAVANCPACDFNLNSIIDSNDARIIKTMVTQPAHQAMCP